MELWFYSGRLGNCMFMYAFTRIIGDTLELDVRIPKGTEIQEFPLIAEESKDIIKHDQHYVIKGQYGTNPKSINGDNDNMVWKIEKNFQGQKMNSYSDFIKIWDILRVPDIHKKYGVFLGNFELGENYTPYRNKLKHWFKFPKIDLSLFTFWKLHPDLGQGNWFTQEPPPSEISKNDLVISLRLEDYCNVENRDRLLTYDYFKIILENRKFNKIYIITNPGSIGHNEQYKYLKEFASYDPIFVRIYDKPVMSMAFGAQFNNIAISQSTYSWWLSFLSDAENIYYPIPEKGPFSLNDNNYKGCDLRVMSKDFKYVDYKTRRILPNDQYTKINYYDSKWID